MEKVQYNFIREEYDAVVMLTWSDWFTEPISNRYHYATRFQKIMPVYFVQPDLNEYGYKFEKTEFDNITVLHINSDYSERTLYELDRALYLKGVLKPILWIYNVYFSNYIKDKDSSLKIFHATEDYMTYKKETIDVLKPHIQLCLENVDMLVGVSQKVIENYNSLNIKNYEQLLLNNGCDYNFWKLKEDEVEELCSNKLEKIVIYQGGINYRLNYDLIEKVANKLSDWKFIFCGKNDNYKPFNKLLKACSNIEYVGFLDVNSIRNIAKKAAVGIIPFIDIPEIKNSFPLKTFEYLATGLPVVSVDIKELKQYDDFIEFANDADEFAEKIVAQYDKRNNKEQIYQRMKLAKSKDYDHNFDELINKINALKTNRNKKKKYINILYDEGSMHVFTIKNYLDMFKRYSRHEIVYTPATGGAKCATGDLDKYDAVIIFYTIRVCVEGHLSASFDKELQNYKGHKVLLIQDDYDTTETTRRAIERLGINTVFTVVPEKYIDCVYPKERFPDVRFYNVLTGYISDEMKDYPNRKSIKDRELLIGYRGRDIGYWYGNLAREKLLIGIRMKEICQQKGLNVDIEWEADKRIYSDKWLEWLSSCKATLGTESGSNVFDDYGEIRKNVEHELKKNPKATYEEIYDKYISKYEGKVKMNQVSPKMFEAISLKTALILFEGSYSGILKEDIHYLSLKKDFSNVDEILLKLEDNDKVQEMVDRAYDDIMLNEKLSYKWLIEFYDDCINAFPKMYKEEIPNNAKVGIYFKRVFRLIKYLINLVYRIIRKTIRIILGKDSLKKTIMIRKQYLKNLFKK